MVTSEPPETLPASIWRERARLHEERTAARISPALQRRAKGTPHPVEDFLFTYYQFSFAKLREWHPPFGTGLEWESALPHAFSKPPYRRDGPLVSADSGTLSEKERARLRWIRELLAATRERAANFGCHGMHEWAMVYRGREIRHEKTATLRLPQAAIDELVESRPIACSHFDAFRFFAPEARPLNKLQPDVKSRPEHEQPGCVHANMDLYKWAGKAMPWVGSELWFECFELALELRDLDMRASPYDLEPWGLKPVPVETSEGRRTYELEQRRLAEKAVPLRERLIALLGRVLNVGA